MLRELGVLSSPKRTSNESEESLERLPCQTPGDPISPHLDDMEGGLLSTTKACSGCSPSMEKLDGGSKDAATDEEVSDAEVADADDDEEPLEYAMLSVAAHLPSSDTAAFMEKVKRHEAARARREQELRQRVASSEAAAKEAVAAAKEAEAERNEALTALRDTDGSFIYIYI